MKFLCDRHRRSILSSPQRAAQHWQDWMQRASELMATDRWQEATRFLGSSFELAEEALRSLSGTPDGELASLQRFMITGHHFAECLAHRDEAELELHVLLTVHVEIIQRVKSQPASRWSLLQTLKISLIMLHRYCKRHGSFAGYYGLCVEAEWLLKQGLH